ncbi:MAG: VWA domain-containing protein [Acidobacteria bacterium]|nr:VWA domain-containing protein [Acidobacteriota bacterium]
MMLGAHTRFLTAALAGIALAVAPQLATAGSEHAFTGTVEVNTVNVDVMVTRHGSPVTDLTKNDFEVFEDGVPQEITNFAKVVDGSVYLGSAKNTQRVIKDTSDVRYRRHIALVFDMNFVSKPWLHRAVQSTRKFVLQRAGKDVDWAVVLIELEPKVLLPFTSNITQVLGALDAVDHQPGYRLLHGFDSSLIFDPMGYQLVSGARPTNGISDYFKRQSDVMADFKDKLANYANREFAMKNIEVYNSLARGLLDVFRAYAAMPGKKACFLVTGNMDLTRRSSPLSNLQPQNTEPILRQGFDTVLATYVGLAHDLWREIERMANTAGFRIYVSNAEGLQQPLGNVDASSSGGPDVTSTFTQSDLEGLGRMLSDATGGQYFNMNATAPALKIVDRELKTYYSLAYRANHGHDDAFHKIVVKVKRPGLKLRYRTGFYDLGPESLVISQMESPATFPKTGGGLPTTVRVSAHPKAGKISIKATVLTPVRMLTFLPKDEKTSVADADVIMAVYRADGSIVSLKREHQSINVPTSVLPKLQKSRVPFAYSMTFTIPVTGRYTVAMAIYDRNAQVYGLAHAQVLTPRAVPAQTQAQKETHAEESRLN